MNRLVLASLAALSMTGLAATSASAFDPIDARQSYQQQRIQQGVRSGEINRHEYRVLQAEQARIAEMERRAKADGYLSYSERSRIAQAQNEASRHIYQESHDRDGRGYGHRRWFRWW